MSKTLSLARKELWSYFSSATALIFLGTYLLVSLFSFFTLEKFFSRNIADIRPLFEWMPVLLIFLVATLTMKMWSDERRMGTVEFLLTLPIKTHQLVLGKFLACMALISLALFLTIGLAVSVSQLGDMDWGPVWGAYIASLLLAAAYTSIGLYVSSKTDSQIISLITTALICLVLFTVGSEGFVGFFGNKSSEVLKLFGSGSRFASISRGVLDLRDIYYYISITAVFLTLNAYSLERLKWSLESPKQKHTLRNAFMLLTVVNLILANVWLVKVKSARADLTEDGIYSISKASVSVIEQLQEPLLIRGYFSARTHPLLAPLVPTIRDLLEEFEIVSGGKVQSEFVDPRESEEIEAEVKRKYNIDPVAFKIEDRHSAAMVNSYFNIVVQYGDQHEILSFNDLIEIKYQGVGTPEVELRNLEYDITRSIRKVMKSFNKTDQLFADLDRKIKFVAYLSEGSLPEELSSLTNDIKKSVEEYRINSGNKIQVEYLDPSQNKEIATDIAQKYGFKPQRMGLFSENSFYFYLTIQDGDKVYALGVPDNLNVEGFKESMDSTLKRLTPGFMRTVGVVAPKTPPMNPMMAQFGGMPPQGLQFMQLKQKIEENYNTTEADLSTGVVDNQIDVLLVLAPKDLGEKEVFALDQFLMKGGSVILATSPFSVTKSRNGFQSQEHDSGLTEWLAHHGVEIPKEFVLDKQNSGFPAVRRRVVQGITIQEPHLVPYPLFVNVRSNGFNQEHGITSSLDQITMAWASPIVINKDKNKNRNLVTLVESSPESWRTQDSNIESNSDLYPEQGFLEPKTKSAQTLGVLIEGRFTSFFQGKDSPLLAKESKNEGEEKHKGKEEEEKTAVVTSVIDKSPQISRLAVYSTNEFLGDDALKIGGMMRSGVYLNPVQLVENTLDWSTEDQALLTMRSRSHFARSLVELKDEEKTKIELLNYLIAMLGLLGVYLGYRYLHKDVVRKRYNHLNLA